MPDPLTPEQRHKCMSHIRGKNTKPELTVRKYLFAHGYRFRLHEKRLPGTPDIVMRRLHTVILVNGCFWHGHNLRYDDDNFPRSSECCKIPRSNTEFWVRKITRNQERDIVERSALTALGWNVIQIWECQLKPAVREATLQSLLLTLSRIELSVAGCKVPKPYVMDTDQPLSMVADESTLPYNIK